MSQSSVLNERRDGVEVAGPRGDVAMATATQREKNLHQQEDRNGSNWVRTSQDPMSPRDFCRYKVQKNEKKMKNVMNELKE